MRGGWRRGRDRRDRVADIKHGAPAGAGLSGRACTDLVRAPDHIGDLDHGADVGRLPGRSGINRTNAGMGMRRAQELPVQHARQLHVDGETRRAGHLGATIDAGNRLADDRELRVDRQRRRLVDGDLALDLAHRHAGDSEWVRL